jgi:hypothetical protein
MPERQALNGAVPHFVQVRKDHFMLRNLQVPFSFTQGQRNFVINPPVLGRKGM